MVDFWLGPILTNNAEWEDGNRLLACSIYVSSGWTNVLHVTMLLVFISEKLDWRNATLTKEWAGHFLFNEEKKDVRVFNGVFPFCFFNPC